MRFHLLLRGGVADKASANQRTALPWLLVIGSSVIQDPFRTNQTQGKPQPGQDWEEGDSSLFPAGNHSEMTRVGGTASHPTPPVERKKSRNKLTQRGPSWWRGKSIAVLKLKPLHKLPLICASLLQISFKSASLCRFIYPCCCCLVASVVSDSVGPYGL